MKLVNLTPHPLNFRFGDTTLTLPLSGQIARLETQTTTDDAIAGIPVVTTRFGRVVGLPDPRPNTVYVTSSLVAQAVRRPDVVAPDTGPTAIRENGQVVAVTRLQRFV